MKITKKAEVFSKAVHLYSLAQEKDELTIQDKMKARKQQMELGAAEDVGNYLADVVLFILRKISKKSRPKVIHNIRRKIYLLNEFEIGSKKMPASASMGQVITFIKHVLFSKDPVYIRRVLNSIVKELALKIDIW